MYCLLQEFPVQYVSKNGTSTGVIGIVIDAVDLKICSGSWYLQCGLEPPVDDDCNPISLP